MFEPVKAGLGVFLQRFYVGLVPTTTGMHRFAARGFPNCVAWAPTRMIDKAEEMLAAWHKNDTDQAATRPPQLPAILVAIAKDYTPVSRSFGAQIADPIDVFIPGDPKHRYFEMRLVQGEVRAQVAIFAHDEPTAKSLAAQFLLFLDSSSNRGFKAVFPFAGVDNEFPVQVETPDSPAMNVDTGSKNMTVLVIDLTLICSIPLFQAPAEGEPNDGKGVPGTDDPAGYPLVESVDTTVKEV